VRFHNQNRERILVSGGRNDVVFPRASRVSRRVSSRGGCVAAFSEGGDSTPRDKWQNLCKRVEAELPAERQVLRRVVRWVGENPVAALVTAVATACTAGAVASALALQLAFSGRVVTTPLQGVSDSLRGAYRLSTIDQCFDAQQ
jgi:hypothetical protein